MPINEKTSAYTQPGSSDSIGAHSYDKIFAFFNKNPGDKSAVGKASRMQVGLKTNLSYRAMLENTTSGIYQNMAGSDLSNIIMPFISVIGSGDMPSFNTTVRTSGLPSSSGNFPQFNDILPFQWDSTQAGFYYDRFHPATSGDSQGYLLSGDLVPPDPDRYRNIAKIKGIGIRTPQMIVGWGYTTHGIPWPSGAPIASGVASGLIPFKNGDFRGWTVDPQDYVAAPFDARYDVRKNVWTAGSQGFWATINDYKYIPGATPTAPSGISYGWREIFFRASGYLDNGSPFPNVESGTTTINPAYEVNNMSVPIGVKVWMYPRDRQDYYLFKYDCPPGSGRFKVLMIADDNGNAVFDYPRFGL